MFLIGLYLPSPVQLFFFPIRLDLLFIFDLHSAEKSIRMQGNLYKRHTITNKRLMIITNVLALVKMAYDCSGICLECAFLTNIRSTPRLLTGTYEFIAIIGNWH